MENIKYIHEIKLKETDKWSKQFNHCSDLFQKSFNSKYNEKEQRQFFDEYMNERYMLELGYYN